MATHAGRLIQDQNLNIHYDGAPTGGKTSASKAQKKGGLGRKALNDISNSGKPTAFQASRKHNSMNVISIGEDLNFSKTKPNASRAPEKAPVSGRKALSDLTNSTRPSLHQVSKKSHDKKLSAVSEVEKFPDDIAEEGFLHNHQECIKAQRKTMDMDYFLKTVGLYNDTSMQLASPQVVPAKPESHLKHLEMEEMSELMFEDRPPQCRKAKLAKQYNSSIFGSPESPKSHMLWDDYNVPEFIVKDSPEKPKI